MANARTQMLTIVNGSTRFVVWHEQRGEHVTISRARMVETLFAQAEALGRGTPAAGVAEQRGLEIAHGGTCGYMTEDMLPAGEKLDRAD